MKFLAFGKGLQVRKDLLPRYSRQLTNAYKREYTTMDCIIGIIVNLDSRPVNVVALDQESNVIHCMVVDNDSEAKFTAMTTSLSRNCQDSYEVVMYHFYINFTQCLFAFPTTSTTSSSA